MSFNFAALERRVAALEAASPASLRFGRVTEICSGEKGGKVRVQLRDGQSMVSHTISTLQKRVLKDQDIEMPDIGEPVACLFSGQGHEEGVVLGAYYNKRERDPGQPPAHDYKRYVDGTQMHYDREAHEFILDVNSGGRILLRVGSSHIEITARRVLIQSPLVDINP